MTKYDDKADLKHLDELNALYEKQMLAGEEKLADETAAKYFKLVSLIAERRRKSK